MNRQGVIPLFLRFIPETNLTGELIMKNLVRGGVILSLIGMFVMIIFAQTRTEDVLSIANDSHQKLEADLKLENNITAVNLIEPAATPETATAVKVEKAAETPSGGETANKDSVKDSVEDKKLVKKTAAVSSAGKRSRGSFIATAYCLKGRTATGQGVRRGIIAADPRVLKLRSMVTLNAGNYSGDYVVSDTGGKIKGNRIDIWMASCSEARRFGRRTVTISQ